MKNSKKINKIEAGDIVKHIPSGEEWIVCGIRQSDGLRLIPCGYPFPTIAETSDCQLIEKGKGQSEGMKEVLRQHRYENYIDGGDTKKAKVCPVCGQRWEGGCEKL